MSELAPEADFGDRVCLAFPRTGARFAPHRGAMPSKASLTPDHGAAPRSRTARNRSATSNVSRTGANALASSRPRPASSEARAPYPANPKVSIAGWAAPGTDVGPSPAIGRSLGVKGERLGLFLRPLISFPRPPASVPGLLHLTLSTLRCGLRPSLLRIRWLLTENDRQLVERCRHLRNLSGSEPDEERWDLALEVLATGHVTAQTIAMRAIGAWGGPRAVEVLKAKLVTA